MTHCSAFTSWRCAVEETLPEPSSRGSLLKYDFAGVHLDPVWPDAKLDRVYQSPRAAIRVRHPRGATMIPVLRSALVLGLPNLYFSYRSREYSQISCRGVLCECGDSTLSLFRECFSAPPGHSSGRNSRNQRLALHSPLRLFLAVPVFWLHRQTGRCDANKIKTRTRRLQ